MSFEKPSNNEDMPFLVNAPDGKVCQFEFKPNSVDKKKTGGPDGKWSCYMIKHKNVIDPKGNEIVGIGEIPFWAMDPFYDAYGALDDKGWVSGSFEVTKDKDDNREVEFSLDDE